MFSNFCFCEERVFLILVIQKNDDDKITSLEFYFFHSQKKYKELESSFGHNGPLV
jgi:hypothetical protein